MKAGKLTYIDVMYSLELMSMWMYLFRTSQDKSLTGKRKARVDWLLKKTEKSMEKAEMAELTILVQADVIERLNNANRYKKTIIEELMKRIDDKADIKEAMAKDPDFNKII